MRITLMEEQITYVSATYDINEDDVPEDRLKEVIELLNKEEKTKEDIDKVSEFCNEFNSDVTMDSNDDSEYNPVSVEDYELETEEWINYEMDKYCAEKEYEEGKEKEE